MNRRAVLATTGSIMIGLGGCLGGTGNGGDDNSTPSNTSTDTPTKDVPSFELLEFTNPSKTCGQHAEGSLASYADMELHAGGSLYIPTQCYEGQFKEVRYDKSTDVAEIVIEAVQLQSDDECTSKCDGVYKYTATIGVSNRMPGTSKLIHRGPDGEEKKYGAHSPN